MRMRRVHKIELIKKYFDRKNENVSKRTNRKMFWSMWKETFKIKPLSQRKTHGVYSKIVELNSPYDSVFMEILNVYYASSIESNSE